MSTRTSRLGLTGLGRPWQPDLGRTKAGPSLKSRAFRASIPMSRVILEEMTLRSRARGHWPAPSGGLERGGALPSRWSSGMSY